MFVVMAVLGKEAIMCISGGACMNIFADVHALTVLLGGFELVAETTAGWKIYKRFVEKVDKK